MIIIGPADSEDLDILVALETKLFAEDAGRHDRFADVSWPEREGHRDFARLIADAACLVLVARDDNEVVGCLVGYLSSSPTRQPVTYAVLRSLYIERDRRRHGIGHGLVDRFVSWARQNGCVEAHVESYTANGPAQEFYERLGFAPQSLSRVLPL